MTEFQNKRTSIVRLYPVGTCLMVLMCLFSLNAEAGAYPDIDGDGRIDRDDIFAFTLGWGKDYYWKADINLDSRVDEKDLALLIRQFRQRDTLATPTPTPTGLLPAPSWIHPTGNGQVFIITQIMNERFLDWSDIAGASAYVYELQVIPQTPPAFNPNQPTPVGIYGPATIKVPGTRTPTPTGPVPLSCSSYSVPHLFQHLGDHHRIILRVAALDKSNPPKLGYWSERRVFINEWVPPPPSPTATPTYPPTPNIDVYRDSKIDSMDVFTFQKSWGTSIGNPAYNARADMDRDSDVDEEDLVTFRTEDIRRRMPISAPRLVFPPDNYEVNFFYLADQGLTFKWDPVPNIIGGISYKWEFVNEVGGVDTWSTGVKVAVKPEIFSKVAIQYEYFPRRVYTWRVWAVSPNGIMPDGPVAENKLVVIIPTVTPPPKPSQ